MVLIVRGQAGCWFDITTNAPCMSHVIMVDAGSAQQSVVIELWRVNILLGRGDVGHAAYSRMRRN